jgi:hypothetical protein
MLYSSLALRRAASVLLQMLPLVKNALQPPVIVCKNEELYVAAMMTRSSGAHIAEGGHVADPLQWWISLASSGAPFSAPLSANCIVQQTPGAQHRRLHVERRIAAQRKAFEAQSTALLNTSNVELQHQLKHSSAATTLASLDAQRLHLLQQFNSLSCEHRATSKAGACYTSDFHHYYLLLLIMLHVLTRFYCYLYHYLS